MIGSEMKESQERLFDIIGILLIVICSTGIVVLFGIMIRTMHVADRDEQRAREDKCIEENNRREQAGQERIACFNSPVLNDCVNKVPVSHRIQCYVENENNPED